MTAIAVCMHTYTGTHIYTYTQGHAFTHTRTHTQRCTNTHVHTSICTSNLLVMRSVLSLELREKREDMKERRKRDERRGGQQRKSHVMFSQRRSECVCAYDRVCVSNWSHLHHLQDTFLYALHVCDVILSRSRYEYSKAKAHSYLCVIVLGCSFSKILFVC